MQAMISRASEPNENSIRYPGWRVAIASAVCVFFGFASLLVYTFGVFLKPLAAEFNWSRQSVAGAFGMAALGIAACSPALGILLDRFPLRWILVPCFAVFGIAFASLSFLTPHLWHLYAIFLLLGMVGNGTAHLSCSRAISTWFQERRGMGIAVLLSGGALGAMVLPLVASALIDRLGWRSAFAILGAMVLLVGLPVGFLVREREGPRHTRGNQAPGASTREGLRSRIFWIIVTVLFLSSITQNGSIAHLASLLTDRGLSLANAAAAASVLGGATLAGRLVTGWLIDRYFAPRVSFCLLAVAALGTFLLSNAQSMAGGALAAACIGFGMGGGANITPFLLTRYFGLRSFSTLYGFTWTVYAIAGALGPIVMGRAFDATGSYQALLGYLSLLIVAAACLMLFLPRYQGEASVEENVVPAQVQVSAAE